MQWQGAQRGGSSPIFKGKGERLPFQGPWRKRALFPEGSGLSGQEGRRGHSNKPLGQHLLSLSEQWWQSVFAPG